MLTDTHTHLYWEDYSADLDEVLNRAKEAGVDSIVTVSVDVATSQKASDFAKQLIKKGFKAYSSIGIHPELGYKYQDDTQLQQDISSLENIYRQSPETVVLVGECGLDYFFDNKKDLGQPTVSDQEFKRLQHKLLKAQVELAHKLNLPLSIHCRDDRSKDPENSECWNDCLDIIKNENGILHCYSGLEKVTNRAKKLNFLISFAGNITYPKNQYLRDAIVQLPLSKIILETDAPFLSPQSSRGQRNEPKTVREIAELIAELKNVSLDEVAAQTTKNFNQLINLPNKN